MDYAQSALVRTLNCNLPIHKRARVNGLRAFLCLEPYQSATLLADRTFPRCTSLHPDEQKWRVKRK